jgi:hypothetical protein
MNTLFSAAHYRVEAVRAMLMAEELPELKQCFLAFARSLERLAEYAKNQPPGTLWT